MAEPVDVSKETEFIEWGIEPGLPVCGKTFEVFDRFVRAYVDRSINGELNEKIRYYYVSPELFEKQELCRDDLAACAKRGYVYAKYPNIHEVVHAIRRRQGAPVGMLYFEEGWAQLFGGETFGWPDDASLADALDYIDVIPPAPFYDYSGHFLSFVTQTHGVAAAELLVDVSADVLDEDDLDAAMLGVLGVGLEDVDASYAGYPRCSHSAWAELLVACSDAPLEWTEAVPEFDSPRRVLHGASNFGCEQPQAMGPFDGRVWEASAIDIDESGTYTLVISDGDRMTNTEFVACGTGCGDVDILVTGEGLHQDLQLLEGRYVLLQSRPLGDPGPVGFALEHDE